MGYLLRYQSGKYPIKLPTALAELT